MNYIYNTLPPLCWECGSRIDYELEDPGGCKCNPCYFAELEKTRAEALEDFRWLSRDWFRSAPALRALPLAACAAVRVEERIAR